MQSERKGRRDMTSEMLDQRNEIDRAISGQTLRDELRRAAEEHGE